VRITCQERGRARLVRIIGGHWSGGRGCRPLKRDASDQERNGESHEARKAESSKTQTSTLVLQSMGGSGRTDCTEVRAGGVSSPIITQRLTA